MVFSPYFFISLFLVGSSLFEPYSFYSLMEHNTLTWSWFKSDMLRDFIAVPLQHMGIFHSTIFASHSKKCPININESLKLY